MSKDTGSVASSDYAWMKLYAAVAALPLALAACGGGGGGSSAPPQSPPPSPSPAPAPGVSITVTPSSTTTVQGGPAITLVAAVTGSTDTPTWTLTGPGSISAGTGTTITYTPPAAGTLTANATVTIAAALTGATTQNVTLTVTVAALAGQTWSNATTTPIGNLEAVDFGVSRYVAVSDQGGALASTDGGTWSAVPLFTSNVPTDHFKAYGLAHSSSTMVAVGSISPTPYTSSSGAVAYSTDGTTWAMGSLPADATPIHSVVWGSRFVGFGEAGHLYSSSDGHSWSALATITGAGTLNSGVFGNGKYVVVGDKGYIAASGDSVAWLAGQVVVVGGKAINLHGITWTGSMFVTVGDNGLITTSKDGSAWTTPATSAVSGTLRSVSASPGGEIVIVGDNGIETSEDGVHWTARDANGAAALNSVTYASGKFVAVGANSAIKTSSGD
ncbi:MAG: hypothetical protein JF586_03470 [Burkholderiales bacterium]|nr:hypothetical protein [Burkholderiales bacterium]